MSSGIGYDSDAGRAICGALTAIMTGISYATSAEMAKELGPFPGFKKNREHMLRVMRNHRRAAHGETHRLREGRDRRRCGSTTPRCPRRARLVAHAKRAWDRALDARRGSTATATRRRPWSRRPAPSAS